MRLNTYWQKRQFDSTPEPKGRALKAPKFRFVVQRHFASRLHYDFRLEIEGVLKSWAIPKGPSLVAGEKRLAVRTEDHPIQYATFYGEIPEGNYGAGVVDIWDEGTFELLKEVPKKEMDAEALRELESGDLKFRLHGTHLNGSFALVRMKTNDDAENWLLIKKSDDFALDEYEISGIESIHAGAKKAHSSDKLEDEWPKIGSPMLATLSNELPGKNAGWIYETKYDGYRALAKINNGKAELFSRNGNNFSNDYRPLCEELARIKDSVVLDGEIVVETESGISDFQQLQNLKRKHSDKLFFYVFDILFLNDHRVTDLPLHERKELLEALMANYEFGRIRLSPFVIRNGRKFLEKALRTGEEGIIGKDAGSTYTPGVRTRNWLKFKAENTMDVFIAGYTEPKNSRKFFGSLILAVKQSGKLEYVGNCGTGFTDRELKELHAKFQEFTRKTSPFGQKIDIGYTKGAITWMKPELLAEVSYSEITKEQRLRHPVFKRLRTDKNVSDTLEPTEAKSAQAIPNSRQDMNKKSDFELSNPTKILFPEAGISKQNILDYYMEIAETILPHLVDRPLSLYRLPNGIHKKGFFQKDKGNLNLPEFVNTVKIFSEHNGHDLEYLTCNNADTLAYLVNLAAFEIHTWHSREGNLEFPDYMLIDLDPDKNTFDEVREVALYVRELCEELAVRSYVKTSGKTGIHVIIPVSKETSFEQTRLFGQIMAEIVQRKFPTLTTVERSIAKRRGKLYIDYLQNSKGQTMGAPYSLRPTKEATVSAPLEWDEVEQKIRPTDFTIETMRERLVKTGDPWKDIYGKGAALANVFDKLQEIYNDTNEA